MSKVLTELNDLISRQHAGPMTFDIMQMADAWRRAYGEDMLREYAGFFDLLVYSSDRPYSVLFTDHEAGHTVYEFVYAADAAAAEHEAVKQYAASFHGDPDTPPDYTPLYTVELILAGHIEGLQK